METRSLHHAPRLRLAIAAITSWSPFSWASPHIEAQQVVTQAERVIAVPAIVRADGESHTDRPVLRRRARYRGGHHPLPTEVIINGKALVPPPSVGQPGTGAGVFGRDHGRCAGVERFLRSLMPDEDINVSASRNAITLSGTVKDPNSVARAVQMAQTTGPPSSTTWLRRLPSRFFLKVRFAEINCTASGLVRLPPGAQPARDNQRRQLVRVYGSFRLFDDDRLPARQRQRGDQALIQAAVAKGDLRPLAEPNLLTLPAKEAYFLAGGEFPYPTVQSGQSNAVTITFKESGVRLRFTPQIARNGAIRLKVAPEVSTLDFANGVTVSGFEILPSTAIETEVELREGQHLAIAGLLDNESTKNLTKIPILGDIPILGELFKSSASPAPDRAGGDRDAFPGQAATDSAPDPDRRAGSDARRQGLGLGRHLGERSQGNPPNNSGSTTR